MRFYRIKKIINNSIYLYEDDIHHINNVLRLKNNEKIKCVYGNKIYLTSIKSNKPFILEIISIEENNILPYNVNIFLGIIDKKYFEIAIKFLNELNCKSITPVWFNRSQRNIKLDFNRLKNIIIESNKQCQRVDLMNINEPIQFSEMINIIKKNNQSNWFLAYENEQNKLNEINLNFDYDVNLIIGPEGGITVDEYNLLLESNVKSLKLTNTILRAETAAIYFASIFINILKER